MENFMDELAQNAFQYIGKGLDSVIAGIGGWLDGITDKLRNQTPSGENLLASMGSSIKSGISSVVPSKSESVSPTPTLEQKTGTKIEAPTLAKGIESPSVVTKDFTPDTLDKVNLISAKMNNKIAVDPNSLTAGEDVSVAFTPNVNQKNNQVMLG
jgi:hypothetical protein